MRTPRLPPDIAALTLSLLLWIAHFTFIYLFTAIACARGLTERLWGGAGVALWAIALATLAAVGGAGIILLAAMRHIRARECDESSGLFWWLAGACAVAAGVAILWEALPLLFLPPCLR